MQTQAYIMAFYKLFAFSYFFNGDKILLPSLFLCGVLQLLFSANQTLVGRLLSTASHYLGRSPDQASQQSHRSDLDIHVSILPDLPGALDQIKL